MPENYVEGSTVNCVLTFQGEDKAASVFSSLLSFLNTYLFI